MTFNNTRMIAYALLSALEEDLRELIKIHLDILPQKDFLIPPNDDTFGN